MSIFDDFDFDRWDEVDHIYLQIDSDGNVDVELELEDGEIVDFDYTWSPEEAEDEIWDELWYWADDEGIEIDKESDYTGD